MAKKFTADRAEFKPSVLMQLAGLSKGMDDLIDLSIGDPDFTTPEPILTAGYQDALKGYTHYSPAKGYPDTIQAVVDSYKRDLGIEIAPENVLIAASGAYSCFLACFSTINPGDELLVADPTFLAYKEQIAAKGKAYGEVPFESEFSESTMNGFLLKVAIDAAKGMFEKTGDEAYAAELGELSEAVKKTMRENAWKNDFFARVLFNRKNKPELEYLGAAGDKLQVEDAPGTYFLNAFSWSVLSGCADEQQISTMLDSMDKYIKSPYGFRLCSTVDYPKMLCSRQLRKFPM